MEREMLRFEEALKIILKEIRILAFQKLPLNSCLGKVLAEDIISNLNNPPLDNSAMDGYGLRSNDLKGAALSHPVKLKLIDTIQAGQTPKIFLKKNKAVRIMTGAPIPRGVDSVVPVEETKEEKNFVFIFKEIEKGSNIRLKAEDIRKNELVIARGKIICPAEIGVLAALGYSQVKVIKNPTVGILATGDELVDINKRLKLGKIRNSNSYSLAAQVLECVAKPVLLGIAKDNIRELKSKIKKGFTYDALIISGGVSMGRTDYVRQALEDLGARMRFWKVAQRPGQPFAFGILKGKPVFCLPGNPVSSMITFEVYVRPALLKMSGKTNYSRPQVIATIEEEIKVKPGKRYFFRVKLSKRNGQYYARLTGPQGSGILKSMVLADGLLIIPEDTSLIRKAERWPIILLKTEGF
jgi:molybdopterin molybdotransferase